MFHPDLALFALKFIFSAVPGAALRLPPAIESQAFSLLCSEPEVAQERRYARHEFSWSTDIGPRFNFALTYDCWVYIDVHSLSSSVSNGTSELALLPLVSWATISTL